ncbi:TraB/GumN family protein [Halobaculum sp. CBA1158]|uniref:TraB/GumN family protein n=1 Tax=Halobaculum sp. CBA1158 TaxID=2904243 RepID=UPI001F4620D2|nr:TraB/GumN family protein [Halobaculum sp. CBA1158]UIO98993.1 TraB/GumN family protein [Halobaculum sp. CBA1158]
MSRDADAPRDDAVDPSPGDSSLGDSAGGSAPGGTPRPSNPDGEGSVRVVGTAHVSEASVREVEATVDEERPDVVAVELDEGRYRQMKGETPDDLDAGDLLRGNTVFQFLAYWMLSYVQTRMGDRFDIEPGAELLAAVETAEDLGISVALVDRDIQTTIQRFWARLSLLEKLRMVGALAFGVTDPRVAGVTFGLVVGLLLGPAIGLFGGAVGITAAVLERVAVGGLAGLVAGYLAVRVADATLGAGGGGAAGGETADGDADGATGLAGLGIGAAVAVAVGATVAVTGIGVAPVAGALSATIVRAVGGLALGLLAGLTVGALAALAIDALGLGMAAGDADEFEGFDPHELTDADVVTAMMEEFRQFSPGGAEALIDERDAYIAHQLVGLRESGYDVVAVVGAGHREGIESYLQSPETLPPMDTLVGTADSGRIPWGKIAAFAISAAFIAFFVLLAMAGVRNEQLLALFAAWFLINGAFAAGLAKLAGARWRSAGVGGAVAWMTSINPLLAPGWFTGYMELRHLTVNVADIGTLNELLSDESRPIRAIVSDMLDVPLFRLIVVVAATNIGSVIASLLFAAYVVPAFAGSLDASITDLMIQGARESARIVWGAVA